MKLFDDIKTVFVDIDDTIWDFTANSKVAMARVYKEYDLERQCPYDKFIVCYLRHNKELWELYHHGKITKEFLLSERFRVVFEECGIKICSDSFNLEFNDKYLDYIAECDKVVSGAHELLDYLNDRGEVYVLSNGFKHLQYRKLQSGKLDKYISKIILSDDIGITKPDKRLFDYALAQVGADAPTTLMIGDNYDADVIGAKNAGWKAVYFNRTGITPDNSVADLTVTELSDIKNYI